MRLKADGALDEGFNPQFGLPGQVGINGIFQQLDGKILAHIFFIREGGVTRGADVFERLLADGSVDGSFKPPGKMWCGSRLFGGADGSAFFTACADGQLQLARLGPDGSEDPAFAFPIGGESPYITAVLAEPDGSRLLAGQFITINGQSRLSLARLRPTPVWRNSTFDATGPFTATIGCLTGWKYRVESSADLKQGDTVATGTSASESVPFANTAPAGTARRFYRVVKE